jgi:hypothetical protein
MGCSVAQGRFDYVPVGTPGVKFILETVSEQFCPRLCAFQLVGWSDGKALVTARNGPCRHPKPARTRPCSAGGLKTSLRRDLLSSRHHKELAVFDPERADSLLD